MTASPTTTLPRRRLGASGLEVSAIGLGCMGMSYAYGPADPSESLRVLHRYVELGGNFLDTAEIYGPYDNERLLGQFLREVRREDLVVATKFGFRVDPAELVDAPLDPPVLLGGEDARHVVAERHVACRQRHDQHGELQPARGCATHQNLSGRIKATNR